MGIIKISPSLLSADWMELGKELDRLHEWGADMVHCDVIDGLFAPNITFGMPMISALKKKSKLPLDVHLMIENPEKYIEPFAKAGADILTFHYEAVNDVSAIVDLIKSFGIKAGMSIKPKTSPDEILKYLEILDLFLVMTVEPGFGGQSFMEDCAEKIPTIKRHAPENLIIQVDGGINAQTAKICTDYGANSLVAGNYIYKSDNIKSAILNLR